MSLVVVQEGAVFEAAAQRVADELKQGSSNGWPGDPSLELHLGVQTDRGGNVLERRWVVKRRAPNGQLQGVAWWYEHELHRITADLRTMRASRPGHVSVDDKIDQDNAAIERELKRQYRDSVGEILDHAARLDHDRNNPLNVFRLNDVEVNRNRAARRAEKKARGLAT